MSALARTAGFAILATCAAALPLGAPVVDGQTVPERLIPDTPEYCVHLRERIRDAIRQHSRPPASEGAHLSGEGELMCDRGETRGGILRLRRAMHILMTPATP
jgi:hypothetical protein